MHENFVMEQQTRVRRATMQDKEFIVALSRRVQEKLTASGSLQQIGPIPVETVEAQINGGTAHILGTSVERLGSVFVEPMRDTYVQRIESWHLLHAPANLWFLQKLMIEPERQGYGLGYTFLEGIKRYIASQNTSSMIVLDCWAGNDILRTFYTRAGFNLYGVFPGGGYNLAVFTWMTS